MPGNIDAAADDELSSGSSSLPDLPPPKSNVEAESRKRPPRSSSRSISGMHHRVRREFNREERQSEQAPENVPAWHRGVAPSLPFMYLAFRIAPASYMPTSTAVRGLEDMLSSPLGQHILSYEPSRGFVIPVLSSTKGKHQFSTNHLQAGRTSSYVISPKDLEGSYSRLIRTVWMRFSIIFK